MITPNFHFGNILAIVATSLVDYAIELFNYAYANDKKPADYAARQEKAGAWLVKSIALNPNSAIANYVMGQHVYNQIYDLEDDQRKIKGTTEKSLKTLLRKHPD